MTVTTKEELLVVLYVFGRIRSSFSGLVLVSVPSWEESALCGLWLLTEQMVIVALCSPYN